jgi:hypothetical protein
MQINRKNKEECNPLWGKRPYFLLKANHITGKVSKNLEIEEYLDNEEDISLDELLSIFTEKYLDKLDFTELKLSVYDHNCDMELRHRILQLVALKLLYSRNTIPERGYERAKRFINEFNKKLGLNLSTKQIDEIMQRDYNNIEEVTYSTTNNVDENDFEEETKGIKILVKRMFNKNKK